MGKFNPLKNFSRVDKIFYPLENVYRIRVFFQPKNKNDNTESFMVFETDDKDEADKTYLNLRQMTYGEIN